MDIMKHYKDSQQKEQEKNKTKVFVKSDVQDKDPMALSAKIYEDSEPKPNLESGKLRFLPALVFVVFIFGLGIWFIFAPKLDYSSSEKRYLQKFPEASFENISSGKFGEEFETYFADHFPQRNMWVGFNSYYTLALGNNGANGVYHAKDGYLINKPVSTDNNLQKNLSAIADFKETIGSTPMTVMLAPSTGYVTTDKLPLVHNSYHDDMYFNNAKLFLQEKNINFVDLRESFRQAYKDGTQLYYRTDHHWTTAGAFLGYEKLCESLGKKPVSRDKLLTQRYPDFYGTTYSTAGFWLTAPDDVEIWSNPDNRYSIKVTIAEGTDVKEYDTLYFYDHLKEDDKYPVFLDGNHALTTIENQNAPKGTIVLVKDSFSHSLAPFLAENYSKVIMVDMRYYKQSVSEIVKQERPEQVVVLYGIDNLATDTDIVWLG